MNAPFRLLAAVVCGLLLGLPAAQAVDNLPVKDIFIHFGTGDNEMRVSPPEVALRMGRAYRIVVINPSEDNHIVAASDELAVMMRTTSLLKGTPKVNYPTGMLTEGILVGPGQMMEWSFTALQDGKAKLGCEMPSHADAGTHTMITVVR